MPFARDTAIAVAGDVGKGGLANSKTVAYENEGEVKLVAGRFVALSPKGVKAVASANDVVAGVVVRSVIKDEWAKGELADVMHIGTGDSIWVEIAKGETVARGDKAILVAADSGDKKAGQLQKAKTGGIETAFTIIKVAGQLAEVTRL